LRDTAQPLRDLIVELRHAASPDVGASALEFLCQVELGLYLQEKLMPDIPAGHAWVLFSGYDFAKARGVELPATADRMLQVARYSLWTLRRGRVWRESLDRYQQFGRLLRGYDAPNTELPASRCALSVGADRWTLYEDLLRVAPPLVGTMLRVAGPGPHAFSAGRSMAVVDLPVVLQAAPVAHDMDLKPLGGCEPLSFHMDDLERTAAEMDAQYTSVHGDRGSHPRWLKRLGEFEMSTRQSDSFRRSREFTVDGIQHLLGIVGAGKSTLRDIIAVHLAWQGKRTTVVVSDVAEVLKLVELYNFYAAGAAAPVLGISGRERHAQRLHRRLAGRGEHRFLAHDDASFAYLGTACMLNVHMQGALITEPLAFGESPCSRLRPKSDPRRRANRPKSSEWQKQRVTCPYWQVCPRHHGSRALVGAAIWVATLPALVDSSPPRPQNAERIRYLEMACRRSDLIIVDEADKAQMTLDQIFAPAVLIAADEERGFIDWLSRHKIRELAEGGRTQLSDRDVEIFAAALNTAGSATDRLYAMLVSRPDVRSWVRYGYFSAWTMQLGMLDERYPGPTEAGSEHHDGAPRAALGKLLDAFRDNPFGDRSGKSEYDFTRLTALLNEILHTGNPENTRRLLFSVMDDLFDIDEVYMASRQKNYTERLARLDEERSERRARGGSRKRKEPPAPQSPQEWREELARRFEFTLLLSALEPRLAMISAMWPRVSAALRLGYSDMYRRPVDYSPMVPEAPMGNVLGFQFRVHGIDEGGVRSGELSFFRCSGVGRELLHAMPTLTVADDRPGAQVLLMSGSSWAGRSGRYHVRERVGVVIEPPREITERIAEESEMRFEFIGGDEKVRVSGTRPESRPVQLRRIATYLGAGAEEVENGGPLERELLSLPQGRDQILLLVGSYDEARLVADTLHCLNSRWRDKVLCLVSDDEELDDDEGAPTANRARTLRRGDVEHLKDLAADVLVAPLLAVERGHNILNEDAEAAIGTVYFLIRPNPHPDDLSLVVSAINDWVVRAQEDGSFEEWVRGGETVEAGAEEFRSQARSRWYELLNRSMAWSRLGEERERITWDLLVLMWQVIGRLVRGGVPARVVFVDAAFAPNRAATPPHPDDATSSLLHSILDVLAPYFVEDAKPADEQFMVRALYRPLWRMLGRCLAQSPAVN